MRTLTVFISSKQSEFRLERAFLKHEIETVPRLQADIAEDWSPETVDARQIYLNRAITAHFYVGLFGCAYSEATQAEYEAARQNKYRELLIYIKVGNEPEPQLAALIAEIRSRHVVRQFHTPDELLVMFRAHMLDALVRSVELLQWLGDSGAKRRNTRDAQSRKLVEAGLPEDPALALSIANDLRQAINDRSSSPMMKPRLDQI